MQLAGNFTKTAKRKPTKVPNGKHLRRFDEIGLTRCLTDVTIDLKIQSTTLVLLDHAESAGVFK